MHTCFKILGLALLATACNRAPLFPGTPRSSHEPATGRHQEQNDSSARDIPPGEHVYITAVRYPDGFDWELDSCAVDGPVWIDLYVDGTRFRSYPAGTSVHPDMHRFTGGHLYADYSTESETVLLRDGEELFRFPGREALRGFLVLEDGIHTLGQDRDGNGFTHRVDGREVFRSEYGNVLGGLDESGPAGGALTQIGEDIYYACRLPSERGMEYRVMQNATVFRSVPELDRIRAFGFVGGKVCCVRYDRRRLFMETDGKEFTLGLQGGEALLWCRLLAWKESVLALLCATGANGRRYFLQDSDGKTWQPVAGETVSDFLADANRMGWAVTGTDGNLLRFRWSDGGSVSMDPDGYLASGRCALLRDGHLFLALTGRGGAPNRFRKDAESMEIPFNGYLTSVTVE
jgi:hypothetical protein